jgi:hypothetical protein
MEPTEEPTDLFPWIVTAVYVPQFSRFDLHAAHGGINRDSPIIQIDGMTEKFGLEPEVIKTCGM